MDPATQAVLIQTLGGIALSLLSALGGYLLKHWTAAAPVIVQPPAVPATQHPPAGPLPGSVLHTALSAVEQALIDRITGAVNGILAPPSAPSK